MPVSDVKRSWKRLGRILANRRLRQLKKVPQYRKLTDRHTMNSIQERSDKCVEGAMLYSKWSERQM